VWAAIDQCVCVKSHSEEINRLVIGLCMDHRDDFFNQEISMIQGLEPENKELMFFAMCMFNQNLGLIERMVEDIECDVHQITEKGYSCLSLGSRYNPNLDVIRYLVEKCKLDVNHIDQTGSTCLKHALTHNDNPGIAVYLMGLSGLDLDLGLDIDHRICRGPDQKPFIKTYISIKRLEEFVLGVSTGNDFKKFNIALNKLLEHYDTSLFAKIIQKINPVLLIHRPELCARYGVDDLMDLRFLMKDFMKLVDDLNCCPDIPVSMDQTRARSQDKKSSDVDFSKLPSLVFTYNGVNYYGLSDIVFNQLILPPCPER
jgi:hypothetical protein